jgi:hypothetical protein
MHGQAFVLSKSFRGLYPNPVKKGKGRDELRKRGRWKRRGCEGEGEEKNQEKGRTELKRDGGWEMTGWKIEEKRRKKRKRRGWEGRKRRGEESEEGKWGKDCMALRQQIPKDATACGTTEVR